MEHINMGTEKTEQYNALLYQLAGVISANIVFAGGEISEIHILSGFERSPKQIVRDVQSALSARFGITVDHKIISVAQIPSDNFKKLVQNRIVFEELTVSKKKEITKAVVVLSYNGEEQIGTGTSINYGSEINRMICGATLQAVEGFFESVIELSLLDLRVHELAGEKVISVCIGFSRNNKMDRFIGCAPAGGDLNISVVKATLHALNRRLSVEL